MSTGHCSKAACRRRSSTTSSWRRASSLLALLALLALAPGAAAQQAGARAQVIADALREDPLYVSGSFGRIATPELLRDLRAAVDAWEEPVWVVWAPSFLDEPGAELPGDLIAQVRDRLGERGVYVWMNAGGSSPEVLTSGRVEVAGDVGRAGIVASEDVPIWQGGGPRLRYLLDHLRTGERPDRGAGRAYLDRDDVVARQALYVLGGTTAGSWLLLTLGWAALRRRRATPRVAEPEADGARDDAEQAIERLAAALERHDGAGVQPAADALEASRQVLDRRRAEPVDAVGALVLARLGHAALDGDEDPRACFFNPLHGWATATASYADGGRALPIPACAACARDVERGRSPDALTDRGKPYWERRTVWARTGFGALDADLVARIRRGER